MYKIFKTTVLLFFLSLALWLSGISASAEEICSYGGAEYLGNHPNDREPGWQDGIQGITHGEGDGDAYWYLAQRHPNRLWRIPFTHKLSKSVSCSQSGVKCALLKNVPILKDTGYNHFGDLDYFDPDPNDDKGGYVFIPLEKEDDKKSTGAVAAFRTPGLEFAGVDYAHYEGDPAPWHMPWAAFDNKGNLYTSEGGSPSFTEYLHPRKLNKWTVDWKLLDDPGDVDIYNNFLPFLGEEDEKEAENAKKVTLLWKMPQNFPYRAMCTDSSDVGFCREGEWIRNIDGYIAEPGDFVPLGLKTPQGADFSDDGRLLFILNGPLGDGKCRNRALVHVNSPIYKKLPREGCGIHVFEVSADSDTENALCSSTDGDCTAVRVSQSRNGKTAFNYEYNPETPDYEEPEGLDWFDMDSPGAPDIPGDAGGACTDPITGATLKPCPVSGQLHAILLNHTNNSIFFNDSAVYIKHYRIGRRDCQDVSVQGIQVVPSFYNFDEVPVGGSAQTEVSINNTGDIDLQIEDIAFANTADAGFGLNGVPTLPAMLSPGDSEQVEVSFMPQVAGSFTAVLEIHSDVPDTPIVNVPFAATAIGFPEQLRNLIDALDEVLANGDLSGAGPGKSAYKRAGAFRNMLTSALEYIEADLFEDACSELKSALDRADGVAPPPDFIAGLAVTALAEEIAGLRSRLGCK